MKTKEVKSLLKNKDATIRESYDYFNHKRELSLNIGDDVYTLHYKVFDSLLYEGNIKHSHTISTIQGDTAIYIGEIK